MALTLEIHVNNGRFFLVKCSNSLVEGTEFVRGIAITSVSARLITLLQLEDVK